EREQSSQLVVINRTLAGKLWPGQDAVGKSILAGDPLRPALIIGVTAEGKYSDLSEAPRSVMYHQLSSHDLLRSIALVAKTHGDPQFSIESIDQTVRAAGAAGPFHPVTYQNWMNFTLLGQRITAGVLAVI